MHIEDGNRLVLILTGALVLLVFMDLQARRHYQESNPGSNIQPSSYVRPSARSGGAIQDSMESILGGMQQDGDQSSAGEAVESYDVAPGDDPNDSRLHDSGKVAARPGENAEVIPDDYLALKPVERAAIRAPESIALYYIRFRKGNSQMVRVRRKYSGSTLELNQVVELLKQGPGPAERGLLNAFDASIKLHSVRLTDGVAVVDLSDRVGHMSNRIIKDRIDQLVLTLTSISGIKAVKILVDGVEVHSLGSEKFPLGSSLSAPARAVVNFE